MAPLGRSDARRAGWAIERHGRAQGRGAAGTIASIGLGLMLIVAAPAALHAQAGQEWLGKRVVPKWADFQLRGPKGANELQALWIYRVEQADGPSLRLQSEKTGLSGWAQADDVVPVEQAIAFFTDHIRSHPGEAYGYHRRADIRLQERKELELALADFDEAIRLDATRSDLFEGRGIARLLRKEYDEAIADFDQALRIHPKHPGYYYNRGLAWLGKEDNDKAIADFSGAIGLFPRLAVAYSFRGAARSRKKEYDGALADFNRAIELDPKLAPAYGARAWLWATCPNVRYRDGKKAVESATMACKLSQWKETPFIDDLAAAYAEAGDFAEAVHWQRKVNAMFTDPKDRKSGEGRLRLYRAKKPYRDTKP